MGVSVGRTTIPLTSTSSGCSIANRTARADRVAPDRDPSLLGHRGLRLRVGVLANRGYPNPARAAAALELIKAVLDAEGRPGAAFE